METALTSTPGVRWHKGMSRENTIAMLAGHDLALGWRAQHGVPRALAALALLLLFRFVANWIGVYLVLLVGREDMAGQLSILVLPFSMITNIFVATSGLPGWLRMIAEWNPVSAVASAVRDLFGSTIPAGAGVDVPLPLQHPVLATLLWSAVLLFVFVPLAVRRFTSHGR